MIRNRLATLLLGLVLASVAGQAAAQCAMCRGAAENAGESRQAASDTFAKGILILLVPTLGVMGGFAELLRRYRKS